MGYLGILRRLQAVVVFATLLAGAGPVAAQYKAVEPKLDTRSSRQEPTDTPGQGQTHGADAAPKPAPPHPGQSKPLVGTIQRTDKWKPRSGRMMGGARQARQNPLSTGLEDTSLQAQAQASIGIIGVKFIATMGRPPLINLVFPGTPAERVGLRVNDLIVAVDGIPTAGLTKDEVFDLIIGTPGTSVTLSIMRHGEYLAVNCTRMDINELTDPRIRRDYLLSM